MGNSSIPLQSIVDDARRRADLAPALATGGSSDQPALSIATDVMLDMVKGGPDGQRFNWKWNRFNVTPNPLGVLGPVGGGSFLTNSWQQDYAVPGVVNLDWIEADVVAVNINQQQTRKQILQLEVKRDISKCCEGWQAPSKICWLPNDQLDYGVWGQTAQNSLNGLVNPGPLVVYTNPLGAGVSPVNPTTQIKDPNGNLWVLTTFGACGASQPSWPTNPAFPTLANQSTAATTQADGSCIWTVVNPKGQGFRVEPLPPQNAVVWLVRAVGQMIAPRFTSLGQLLNPVPDDHVTWFRQGFFARCYLAHPDPKIRSKFTQEYQLWLKGLDNAVKAGNREEDNSGFYPGGAIMDAGCGMFDPGPLYPFAGWWR